MGKQVVFFVAFLYTYLTMKLTVDDIEHVARLARLHLSEEEKIRYADQLSVVLDYIEILNEVPTENVEETTQVTGLVDVTREDVVQSTDEITRKKMVEQFPEKIGPLLKVRAVFEET